MSEGHREISKGNWAVNSVTTSHNEQIKIGSLQRIADATEKMASNYTQLQNERDLYKRWYEAKNVHIKKLEHSNAALRGHIKRLKKREVIS